MKYYKSKLTGREYKEVEEIYKGSILTAFNPNTGTPISNSGYKMFVDSEDLKNLYTPFKFIPPSSEIVDNLTIAALGEILNQIQNYGILENETNLLLELRGSSAKNCSMLRDIVKENPSWEDYLDGNRDEWEYGDSNEIFDFLKALSPVLKVKFTELELQLLGSE